MSVQIVLGTLAFLRSTIVFRKSGECNDRSTVVNREIGDNDSVRDIREIRYGRDVIVCVRLINEV